MRPRGGPCWPGAPVDLAKELRQLASQGPRKAATPRAARPAAPEIAVPLPEREASVVESLRPDSVRPPAAADKKRTRPRPAEQPVVSGTVQDSAAVEDTAEPETTGRRARPKAVQAVGAGQAVEGGVVEEAVVEEPEATEEPP